MGENVNLHWGVGRVWSPTLDLLEDEERRCLDLSIMQCSILRQMVFPWVRLPSRLVEDHGDYQTTVDMPEAYLDALDELEQLLSGAYDGPETGCPVGEVYVDRGDLPGWDFGVATLTIDGNWHELDLTNVIGEVAATRVLVRVAISAPGPGYSFWLRQGDNTSNVNASALRSQVAGQYTEHETQIQLPGTQHIAYLGSAGTTDALLVVRGYWMPAA